MSDRRAGDLEGKPDTLLFSYGSNMCRQRLLDRAPSVRILGRAVLVGRALRFHKKSDVDGSGKADAQPTGSPDDRVWGVMARLSAEDRRRMDEHEGVGEGYRVERVRVRTDAGRSSEVILYRAQDRAIRSGLRPFAWYLRLVVAGARQRGLPDGYVRSLERRRADIDPNPERARRNLSVLDRDRPRTSLSGGPGKMQVADDAIGHPGREAVMPPPSGKKPVPPRLLNQLATTLRALEGPRQGEVDVEASVTQTHADLAELREVVAKTDPASLPEGVLEVLEKARAALDETDLDRTRELLVGVGRSIDAHLKG